MEKKKISEFMKLTDEDCLLFVVTHQGFKLIIYG